MLSFSQKDERWKDLKIGLTNNTLEKYGCYIVSLAMYTEKPPYILLDILNTNSCFVEGGLLLNTKAAAILNMTYKYSLDKPDFDCIAETNHYRSSGYPQHFFVLLKDGKIIDPLDGETKENPYHIVSYRLWIKNEVPKKEETKEVKNMDWKKSFQSGLKYLGISAAAVLLSILIGALTSALNFKPEGLPEIWTWQYLVVPALTGLLGLLNNIRKHIGS